MKRMTRKLYGILILSMLATSAHAGWLSNLGQRIVNGAANTVQNNISGKVNKTIDDVMDGKIGQPNNKNKQKQVETVQQNIGTPSSTGTSIPMVDNQVDSSGMLSLDQVRRRALPFKGVYEEVDLGSTKIKGERIYDTSLRIGEVYKNIDVYLLPGLYAVCFIPNSYDVNVGVIGNHDSEGIFWGYGIKIKRTVIYNGLLEMNLKKGSTIQIIEAGINGGHIEVTMANDASRRGAMDFIIFKVPDTTVRK